MRLCTSRLRLGYESSLLLVHAIRSFQSDGNSLIRVLAPDVISCTSVGASLWLTAMRCFSTSLIV